MSMFTHLLRDAQYRGIYTWPLGGNTQKIPRGVIVVSFLLFPLIAILLQTKCHRTDNRGLDVTIKV